MTSKTGVLLLLALLASLLTVPSEGKDDAKNSRISSGYEAVWVHFMDKPSSTHHILDPKAAERRLRHGRSEREEEDLKVSPIYLKKVKEILSTDRVSKIRTISSLHNAVSVEASASQIHQFLQLDFVSSVEPIAVLTRKAVSLQYSDDTIDSGGFYGKRANTDQLGFSKEAWIQTNSEALLDANLDGNGVRIMVMDTGYNLKHESMKNLTVAGQFDFIKNDPNTENESGDDEAQQEHGTYTLSTIAGYTPGKIFGPARNAQYLLAKTERIGSDMKVEEDYFSAACVWGELRGADLFSISIGYFIFYNFNQFDGKTAKTTQAINLAVKNGVVVVMAVGNRGAEGISPPSDAPLTIGVGSVDKNNDVAGFSSVGPTADMRIKPDVVALGVQTYVASPSSSNTDYGYVDGTSTSAPFVAGITACLMQKNPTWTNIQIREAILRSASNFSTPNTRIGFGTVNAAAALKYSPAPNFCPTNCSYSIGGGSCNQTLGTCTCNEGFYDFDCSMATLKCGNYCSTTGGKCEQDICVCLQDYGGVDCSQFNGYRYYLPQVLIPFFFYLAICIGVLIAVNKINPSSRWRYSKFLIFVAFAIGFPLFDIALSEGVLHQYYPFTIQLMWEAMDFVWKVATAALLFKKTIPTSMYFGVATIGALIHVAWSLPVSYVSYVGSSSNAAFIVQRVGNLILDYLVLPAVLYYFWRNSKKLESMEEEMAPPSSPSSPRTPKTVYLPKELMMDDSAIKTMSIHTDQQHLIKTDEPKPTIETKTWLWEITAFCVICYCIFDIVEVVVLGANSYHTVPYTAALLFLYIPMAINFFYEHKKYFEHNYSQWVFYLFLIGAYVEVPVEIVAELYVVIQGSQVLGFFLQVGQSILMFLVTHFMALAAKKMITVNQHVPFIFRYQFFEEFLSLILFLRKDVTGVLFWVSIIFQTLWSIYRNSGVLETSLATLLKYIKRKFKIGTQSTVHSAIGDEQGRQMMNTVITAQQYVICDVIALIAIPAQFYTLLLLNRDYASSLGIKNKDTVWQTFAVLATVTCFAHVVVYAILRWRIQAFNYHRHLQFAEEPESNANQLVLPGYWLSFLSNAWFHGALFTVLSFVSTRDAYSAVRVLFSVQDD